MARCRLHFATCPSLPPCELAACLAVWAAALLALDAATSAAAAAAAAAAWDSLWDSLSQVRVVSWLAGGSEWLPVEAGPLTCPGRTSSLHLPPPLTLSCRIHSTIFQRLQYSLGCLAMCMWLDGHSTQGALQAGLCVPGSNTW